MARVKPPYPKLCFVNMGVANRLGRLNDGTTISDHDYGEIERQISPKGSLINGGVTGVSTKCN